MRRSILIAFLAVLGVCFVTQSAAQVRNHETEGSLESFKPLECVSADQVSNINTPADIFAGLAKCLELREYDLGASLYGIGMAYGVFDSRRVKDKTAHQAISVLRLNVLGGLNESAISDFQDSIDTVLGSESGHPKICDSLRRIGPPAYHPTYMIQHGMGAFGVGETGLVVNFEGDAAWSEILIESFSCPGGGEQK